MVKLVLGLALWMVGHSLKRLAPGLRRDMSKALGEKISRGVISLVLLVAVVFMLLGYKQAANIHVYSSFAGAGYINNILMFAALFSVGIGPAGGRLSARFRHPMLFGAILWGAAHLLVSGDAASVVLFGGLSLWALVQMRLINQHEGPWERPMPGDALRDYKLVLATLFLYVFIAGIHWLFGHNPFLGTYG